MQLIFTSKPLKKPEVIIRQLVGDGKEHHLPDSDEFGTNKVTVFVNPNVLINQPDPQSGQYSLNHEAGHFVYWAAKKEC